MRYPALMASIFLASCAAPQAPERATMGFYAYPGDGPVIVLLGGSEGGYFWNEPLQDALLEAGFAVTLSTYFGLPKIAPTATDIDIDAVARVLAEEADGRCLGVFGVSKGAELALVLAAYRDVADATVAMAPSHVVWQSSRINPVGRSSWVLDGAPMDYVPYGLSWNVIAGAVDPEDALGMHEDALKDEAAVAAAVIPVEQVTSPVLLQAPTRDQVWPALTMAEAAMARADKLNPGHPITLKTYDHDHYLLQSDAARADVVAYFQDQLAHCR